MEDVIYTNGTDTEKPCNHHRCKKETDSMGPIMLQSKQKHKYGTGYWDFNICKIEKAELLSLKGLQELEDEEMNSPEISVLTISC